MTDQFDFKTTGYGDTDPTVLQWQFYTVWVKSMTAEDAPEQGALTSQMDLWSWIDAVVTDLDPQDGTEVF